MTPPIKRLSYSSLSQLVCPYAFFLKYEGLIRGETTEYLALGSALHTVLEDEHTSNPGFNLKRAVNSFQDEFMRILKDDDVLVQWAKVKKLEGEGISMLERYDKYLPTYPEPTHVEKEFSIQFEGIEIVGKIDRIEPDDVVADYKSGALEPDEWFLRHDLQFTMYAWAYRELFGRLPKKLIWWGLRKGHRLETIRTEEDIADLQQMIRNAVTMRQLDIRHRVFNKEVCKYCDYRGEICDDKILEAEIVGSRE